MKLVRRLDTLLLAGVGVLAVHQVSYTISSLAGTESTIAHGHLGLLWLVASLGAVAGIARSVMRSIRQRGLDISPVTLMVAIIGAYTMLESIERVASGLGATALFGEAVFWIGLAATPLVSLVLARAVSSAVAAIAAGITSADPDRRSAQRVVPRRIGASTATELTGFGSSQSWRGPPLDIIS